MELHVTKRKGREIVVLLDNDMRIVKPVYDYLKYQDQRDRAINTLIAYGNDLKAFWEFLSDYGYAYDEVSPKMIGEYKEYLIDAVIYTSLVKFSSDFYLNLDEDTFRDLIYLLAEQKRAVYNDEYYDDTDLNALLEGLT